MLWELNFYKTPDSPHSEQFTVGYFVSLDEVEAVKAHYMSRVPGFRDTPWGSWEIIGHAVDIPGDGILWQVYGWNWSPDCNECDRLQSPLFADRTAADSCLAEFTAHYQRDVLEMGRIVVNERMWAQGFDSE